MKKEHLNKLKSCLPADDSLVRWGAMDPNKLASVVNMEMNSDIPVKRHIRSSKQRYSDVMLYSSGIKNPVELAAISIFAWGGIRPKNAKSIFGQRSREWLNVCNEIRCGNLDRQNSYQKFFEMNQINGANSMLSGLGPAFWTKLIHFLMPRNGNNAPGYILDQWADASVNMIYDNDIVKMNRYSTLKWKENQNNPVMNHNASVSEFTTSIEYENFCLNIEELAIECRCNEEKIDVAFMSPGGSDWRKYLKENYISVNDAQKD